MDDFFQKLANFFTTTHKNFDPFADDYENFTDPDVRQAWAELDDYIRTGKTVRTEHAAEQPEIPKPAKNLKQAYYNLEVPFGAPFAVVKRAYKRLLVAYHPDRYSNDPEKQRISTEITQQLNESFTLIKHHTNRRP